METLQQTIPQKKCHFLSVTTTRVNVASVCIKKTTRWLQLIRSTLCEEKKFKLDHMSDRRTEEARRHSNVGSRVKEGLPAWPLNNFEHNGFYSFHSSTSTLWEKKMIVFSEKPFLFVSILVVSFYQWVFLNDFYF